MTKPAVEGIEETNRNLAKLGKVYGEAVVKASVAGAELVRGAAIQSIQSTSGGKLVTRSREGEGTHQHTASKPGDAPNTDTGDLVRHIQVDINPLGIFVGVTGEVGKYASYLEFGTSSMEPRPWLNPALESQRRNIEKLVADAVSGDKTV